MEPSQNSPTEPTVEFRLCHSHDDFRACMAIQRAVWNDPGLEVPFALFVVAAETGGQVLGAFESGKMVGFTFAMAAMRDNHPYLHSHMTAVLETVQNRGIGRGLKTAQRADALRRGIGRVEWTFDPLEIRNAHFNLVRLGAIVRRYIPNCYGITASPLHAGLPTDRLVAEWDLGSARVERCLKGGGPAVPYSARAERVAVPRAIGQIKRSDSTLAREIQSGVREQFQRWLRLDYRAVGLDIHGDDAEYLLEPRDG